jgi:hypothetical protein
MLSQWNCLTCSRKTCQTEQEGSKVGIEKKHLVLFIRYAISCSWVGPRTSATRDLSTAILIIASVWLIVQTTRSYISLYFGYIPVKPTCSICCPWKQICPALRKTRVMVLRNPVAGSSIDKECETGVCELGIRYPTLQAIYAGKLNRQSIQVISIDIIYDIIVLLHDIVFDITYNFRCRAEKQMLERRPMMHTIILQARSAWTCIFLSLLGWI